MQRIDISPTNVKRGGVGYNGIKGGYFLLVVAKSGGLRPFVPVWTNRCLPGCGTGKREKQPNDRVGVVREEGMGMNQKLNGGWWKVVGDLVLPQPSPKGQGFVGGQR